MPNIVNTPHLTQLWEKAEKGTDSAESRMQMLQAQMGAKMFGGFEVGDIEAEADGAMQRGEGNVNVSRMQRQVTESLEKKMPGVWEMEHYPFSSCDLGGLRAMNVDLAWPDKKICIEVQVRISVEQKTRVGGATGTRFCANDVRVARHRARRTTSCRRRPPTGS